MSKKELGGGDKGSVRNSGERENTLSWSENGRQGSVLLSQLVCCLGLGKSTNSRKKGPTRLERQCLRGGKISSRKTEGCTPRHTGRTSSKSRGKNRNLSRGKGGLNGAGEGEEGQNWNLRTLWSLSFECRTRFKKRPFKKKSCC